MKAIDEYLSSKVDYHVVVDIESMSLDELTAWLKDNGFDEIPEGKMHINGNAYTMFQHKTKAFLIWYDEHAAKSFFSDWKSRTYSLLISDGQDILCDLAYNPEKEFTKKQTTYCSGFYGSNYRYKRVEKWGDNAIPEIQSFLAKNEIKSKKQ